MIEEYEASIAQAQQDIADETVRLQQERVERMEQALRELFYRSNENVSTPIEPVPILAPDATQDEIVDTLNRLIHIMNMRFSDGP